MVHNPFSRTQQLIGVEGIAKLKNAKVAVFGIGGVGSFVVEGLTRAGIGHFYLLDDDTVNISNLNRQLHATHATVGRAKVDIMKERIMSIHPEAEVEIHQIRYLPENAESLFPEDVDYIVDAIDSVSSKIDLIVRAQEKGIPIISSMGTGNKLDPTRFEVTDISKTSVCPLARVMRYELKKRGINHLRVIYSKENPIKPEPPVKEIFEENGEEKADTSERWKHLPGSISFVPSVAGLIMAGEVVRDILGIVRKS